MFKRILILLLAANLMAGAGFAQKLSQKEIKQSKTQIVKLQKEINRLSKKLKTARTKQLRKDILGKINLNRSKITKIKGRLYPKAAPKPRIAREVISTIEAAVEEGRGSYEVVETVKRKIRYEAGGVYGFFAGTTALLGEVRVPLQYIFGPATTTVRLSTGLTQSRDTSQRHIPLNLDLLFNFPPGWLTGVENYAGAGLNYIALMSGGKQGMIGGEVFYGVQSEGFGGVVFGELGYAVMRAGSSPAQKGISALIGYRKVIGF